MNRDRLEHRCTVSRPTVTRQNGKTVATGPQSVANDVPCWAEGIATKVRALVYGRSESARYVLTWMDDVLKNEDQITLTHPPVGTFVVRGIQHDIQGGYWFGTLEERK